MPKKPRKSLIRKKEKKGKKESKKSEVDFFKIIKEHDLVPEARVLKEKEVEELLKKYNIKKENLPKIFSRDPLVKITGAKVGDVIEIKRKSDIAGESYYYRLVIE